MCNAATDSHFTEDSMEIHLDAYNAAFCELGLKWHWNTETYQTLQRSGGDARSVQSYLETHQPHLLKVYDLDFLTNVIHVTKARCYESIIARGPGVALSVDWAEIQRHEVGF